jgi:hypothetical protein
MRIFGNSSKEKGQRKGRKMRVGGWERGAGGVNTKVRYGSGYPEDEKIGSKILPICSMESFVLKN